MWRPVGVNFLAIAGTLTILLYYSSSSSSQVPSERLDGERGTIPRSTDHVIELENLPEPPLSKVLFSSLPLAGNREVTFYTLFTELPAEIREEIFLLMDIGDYANHLIGNNDDPDPRLCLSPKGEEKIIKRAAVELGQIKTSSSRYKTLANGVQALIRHCSKLPLYSDGSNVAVAQLVMDTYHKYSAYSEQLPWKIICIKAVMGKNVLTANWHLFDLAFITKNLDIVIKVAKSRKAYSTLREIRMLVRNSILESESIELFTLALASHLFNTDRINKVISTCIRVDRPHLLHHVWKVVLTDPTMRRDLIIKYSFFTICKYTRLDILHDALKRFPLTKDGMSQCLLGASESGNVTFLTQILSLKDQNDLSIFCFSKAWDWTLSNCFQSAAKHDHLPMMHFLLSQHNKVPGVEKAFLAAAVKFGNYEMINIHLGLDTNYPRFWPNFSQKNFSKVLEEALASGRLDVYLYLTDLQQSSDRLCQYYISFPARSVFEKAYQAKHRHVVDYLLRQDTFGGFLVDGMDATVRDGDLLMGACLANKLKVVKLLLKYDIAESPIARKNDALVMAATWKHWDIVKLLLQKSFKCNGHKYTMSGIDPAVKDNIVLHYAVLYWAVEVVSLLLGCDKKGRQVFPGVKVTPAIRNILHKR